MRWRRTCRAVMTLLQRRDPGAACCTTAPDLPTELWAQIVILGAPDLVDGFLVPSSALGSVSRACALGMADAQVGVGARLEEVSVSVSVRIRVRVRFRVRVY